jgi:hypothetical protein
MSRRGRQAASTAPGCRFRMAAEGVYECCVGQLWVLWGERGREVLKPQRQRGIGGFIMTLHRMTAPNQRQPMFRRVLGVRTLQYHPCDDGSNTDAGPHSVSAARVPCLTGCCCETLQQRNPCIRALTAAAGPVHRQSYRRAATSGVAGTASAWGQHDGGGGDCRGGAPRIEQFGDRCAASRRRPRIPLIQPFGP